MPTPLPTEKLQRWAYISLIGLFVCAVVSSLYFAADVFIPLVGAVLMGFTFAPLIRPLARRGVPSPLLAAIVLATLIGVAALAVTAVSKPAIDWIDRAPKIAKQLERKFRPMRESVATVEKASADVMNLTNTDRKKRTTTIVAASPSMMERIAGGIQHIGVNLAMMLVLLYFLLAAGDMFKEKTVRLMPTFHDKRAVVSIINKIESEVSSYLITILLINVALGAVVGGGLYAIGLNNALFWGITVAILNFIPYIGFLIGLSLVTVAALLQFSGIGDALLAPAIYTVANMLEASFITPSLLGRRFTLNPVIVFLSVVIWTWLWGIPGALMAVPITVVMNVIFSHIPALRPLNEYLSGRVRVREAVIT
ncbi:AI-2E family transporter [Emcibacter sp. SYSU 3D8]|uniref:AI-2E family transporter n=1 Tax=Emcibacter sp. SYSU 3D8 TaxID=3133969 RepID=UPI0031FE63DD